MDENPHRDSSHPQSEKQTNMEEHKLTTTIAAVTDPKFPLPTLTSNAGPVRYVLSFATLSVLLGGGIAGAYFLDLELLRSEQPLVVGGSLFAVVLGALFLTGTVWIDWFELVVGYWWLSMPIGALAGLVLVMNQEASAGLGETT